MRQVNLPVKAGLADPQNVMGSGLARLRPDITGARPDESPSLGLFEHVGKPPDRARQGKDFDRRRHRKIIRRGQRGEGEIDVGALSRKAFRRLAKTGVAHGHGEGPKQSLARTSPRGYSG